MKTNYTVRYRTLGTDLFAYKALVISLLLAWHVIYYYYHNSSTFVS
nr:hypothetical protein [Mucilaginibacter sp. X5P1]